MVPFKGGRSGAGNLSGVARRAARDKHPQPLTGVGREASKPRGTADWDAVCSRRLKNATAGGAGRFEKPAPDARAAPPEAHESLISRKTGAEVPLTGLSFRGHAI